MASISTDAAGNRRIQFIDSNGKRKAIRLGKMSMKHTQEIKSRVEHLISAKVSGCGWDAETARYVRDLTDELAEKLAAVDLIPKRDCTLLGPFVDAYVASCKKAGAKQNTLNNMKQARDYLVEFFGETKRLRDIVPGDTDDYRRSLSTKVGENTSRRHLGRAKQFFRYAARKRLIVENPFADMKNISVQPNAAREFFITREMAAKVLDACPDLEWRLIFALSRFGGLRCPSEHMGLTWSDINWAEGRFRVTSPKTEHHEGHGERWVPIFDELRPLLAEAFDKAEPGTVHVITEHRTVESNLRTHMHRIIRRAGFTPWPKTFQNLRSTRETELFEAYPTELKEICGWLGNSPVVAIKHYMQNRGTAMERATVGARAAHFQAQSPSVTARHASTVVQPAVALAGEVEACRTVSSKKMPPIGIEPTTCRLGNDCSIH